MFKYLKAVTFLVYLSALPLSAFSGSLIIGIPGDSNNSSMSGSDYVGGGYDGRVSEYKADYIEGGMRTIFKKIAPNGWNIICEPTNECDRIIKIKNGDKRNWVSVLKDATKDIVKKDLVIITVNERTKVVFVKGNTSAQVSQKWHISKNGTLKSTLNTWSSKVGYRLKYELDLDWTTGLDIDVKGTFDEVVMQLVDSFRRKGASVDVIINHKLKLVDISTGSSMYELK